MQSLIAGGNSVICKPAAQTPLIAYEAIQLLYQAGVPDSAVHLVLGDGRELGNHLSAHPDINGICFTGSTATAKKIAGQLVKTERAHIPLIAETGGLNAMIVDSTALLEQVVADVIASAFQSAGQRCSACHEGTTAFKSGISFNRCGSRNRYFSPYHVGKLHRGIKN